MAWQRKDGRVAKRRAEVLLDLRFRETAPIAELPVLHWVGVWCCQPVHRERFIPAGEEATMLQIEEKLLEIAGGISNGWAVYVMRTISEGIAEYYFYARENATLDGLVVELKKLFPEHRIEQEARIDPDWAEYHKYLSAPG